MRRWLSPNKAGNGILWIVAVAVQIGGWFNQVVAIFLLAVAFLWSVVSIVYWLRRRNKPKDIQRYINVKPATGKRESDWERTEHLMWAELQATNTNPNQELNDVEVSIVKCLTIAKKQDSPNPNEFLMWDFLNLKPFCVYWSERQAQPKQMCLVIPGGGTRSAVIAFQDNSNGGNFNFNTPFYHWVVGGVRIDVEISSCNSVLWQGIFYIECHPNYLGGDRAKFEFVEWDKWVANRNITLLNSDNEGSQTE